MEKTRAAVKKARYLAGEQLDWDETPTLSNGKRPLNVLNVRINTFGLKDYLIEWDDGTGAGWVSVEELGSASGILKKWERRANPKGRNMYVAKHPQEFETNYERDFSKLSKRKFYERAMDGVDENSKGYEQPSENSKSKKKVEQVSSAREISQRKERKNEQSRKRTATEPSHIEAEVTENALRVKTSKIVDERNTTPDRRTPQKQGSPRSPTEQAPPRPSTSRPSGARQSSHHSAKRISPLPSTREDILTSGNEPSTNNAAREESFAEDVRPSTSRREGRDTGRAESKDMKGSKQRDDADRSSKGSGKAAGENSTVKALAALQSEDEQHPAY